MTLETAVATLSTLVQLLGENLKDAKKEIESQKKTIEQQGERIQALEQNAAASKQTAAALTLDQVEVVKALARKNFYILESFSNQEAKYQVFAEKVQERLFPEVSVKYLQGIVSQHICNRRSAKDVVARGYETTLQNPDFDFECSDTDKMNYGLNFGEKRPPPRQKKVSRKRTAKLDEPEFAKPLNLTENFGFESLSKTVEIPIDNVVVIEDTPLNITELQRTSNDKSPMSSTENWHLILKNEKLTDDILYDFLNLLPESHVIDPLVQDIDKILKKMDDALEDLNTSYLFHPRRIILNGEGHWILNFFDLLEKKRYTYDPLKRMTNDVDAAFLRGRFLEFTFKSEEVPVQTNNIDCGVLILAIAAAEVTGSCSSLDISIPRLRPWLLNSLTKKKVQEIPSGLSLSLFNVSTIEPNLDIKQSIQVNNQGKKIENDANKKGKVVYNGNESNPESNVESPDQENEKKNENGLGKVSEPEIKRSVEQMNGQENEKKNENGLGEISEQEKKDDANENGKDGELERNEQVSGQGTKKSDTNEKVEKVSELEIQGSVEQMNGQETKKSDTNESEVGIVSEQEKKDDVNDQKTKKSDTNENDLGKENDNEEKESENKKRKGIDQETVKSQKKLKSAPNCWEEVHFETLKRFCKGKIKYISKTQAIEDIKKNGIAFPEDFSQYERT